MTPTLHVNIKNKENVLYEGEVTAVTSFNDLGLFDVLPMHENFISLIKNKVILHKNKAQKEFRVDSGVLKVRDNKVNIYIGL
jgi:F0F1-type ATP synthase epsilon subunit